jgi:hypothetical protein
MASHSTPTVVTLQRLLAQHEHEAFLDALVKALDAADPSQLDYLRALGGEGLHALLNAEYSPGLLGAYARLLLSGSIHAPASCVLALNERLPSSDLVALAENSTHSSKAKSSDGQHGKSRTGVTKSGSPIQLRRIVQIIDMGFGTYSASDALGLKRSVFRSDQERTFLQALSLRFPGLHAFPNYPLDQLADFDKLRSYLDAETIKYGVRCRVDAVLVVPGEGDPVAAFELDSKRHDEPAQTRKDQLRNRLFQVIQIPLFRLRAEQGGSIGIDEWYALLTDEVLDKVDCGRRLRVRASHPTLVPI